VVAQQPSVGFHTCFFMPEISSHVQKRHSQSAVKNFIHCAHQVMLSGKD